MSVSPVAMNRDAGSTTTSGNGVEDLMNGFITLLVAQLQNQDPTNPMDNSELTSQITQMTTAAGVAQLNNTVSAVGMLVTSMQQMNATQWIGREVLIEGDSVISNTEGGNQTGAFSIAEDADVVHVVLTDSAGNAYTAELRNVDAGIHQFSMDDLTDFQPSDPREIEGGKFTVSYSTPVNSETGTAPSIVSLKKGTVEGVSFTPSGALLELGDDGSAMLGQIYQVE
jgi:flagellar basal-body rod modification protein FlgD